MHASQQVKSVEQSTVDLNIVEVILELHLWHRVGQRIAQSILISVRRSIQPPVGVQYNSIMQPEGIMDPWGGPSYLWKECNNIPFLLESTSYLRNLRDSIERPGTFQ